MVFKAYDVRGTVPDELDGRVAFAVGAAFAQFASTKAGAGRIIVARDMRDSGPMLARAVTAGALSSGARVVDIGLSSTDMAYFASGYLDAPAVMLTASHNPARYNGMKLCLPGAVPVGQETGLAEIRDRAAELLDAGVPAERELAALVERGRSNSSITQRDVIEEYRSHVLSFVDQGALRPLRVIADTANGMGGLVVPKVFEGLPFELHVLFPELDGSFPNHPADPIQPENLVALQEAVRAAHGDIGLAFDGDADRVFLVDEHADPVSGSLTTALVASALLDKHPGETILYNLICSRAVPEVISEQGGKAVRTRVGHSFIKKVMGETGALFGGEHSGHYYFRDNYRADSGLIAALVVLELMSKTGRPLSELLAPYRRYASSGEVNVTVDDPVVVVERVATRYRDLGLVVDVLDGCSVEGRTWWANLRPSNTEPLLRCNVEAVDEDECAARLADVLEVVDQAAEEIRKEQTQ